MREYELLFKAKCVIRGEIPPDCEEIECEDVKTPETYIVDEVKFEDAEMKNGRVEIKAQVRGFAKVRAPSGGIAMDVISREVRKHPPELKLILKTARGKRVWKCRVKVKKVLFEYVREAWG